MGVMGRTLDILSSSGRFSIFEVPRSGGNNARSPVSRPSIRQKYPESTPALRAPFRSTLVPTRKLRIQPRRKLCGRVESSVPGPKFIFTRGLPPFGKGVKTRTSRTSNITHRRMTSLEHIRPPLLWPHPPAIRSSLRKDRVEPLHAYRAPRTPVFQRCICAPPTPPKPRVKTADSFKALTSRDT